MRPLTVRGWLIAQDFRGFKFNGRDWRVPRAALREYLDVQAAEAGLPKSGRGYHGLAHEDEVHNGPNDSRRGVSAATCARTPNSWQIVLSPTPIG